MTISRRDFLSSSALIGASAAIPAGIRGAFAKGKAAETQPIALPPGVSKTKFLRAVREFGRVVGSENVLVDVERLVSYKKIMLPENEALHEPAGVVMATTVEQVQGVLEICNKYAIPIWPISTGRNYGYGSAAPATRGQMVLDLRRMNKILDVDPEMCTALVEPGVTYRQLHDYIAEHDLPLWLSFPSPGPIAGPVGNTLERGVGYNRYGEQVGHFCGLEVVLADGTVLRTGMGGVARSNTWQCYRWGYGPWLDGIFTQSNFGVVTKMGLWLMPRPPAHKAFMIGWRSLDGFIQGVDVARRLRLAAVLENGVMGEALYGIATGARRADLYKGPGAIPDDVLAKIYESVGAPPWSFVGVLYGTDDQIGVNWRIVEEAFAGTGGTIICADEAGKRFPAQHMVNNMTGQLELEEFGLLNFRGGGGSVWFAPVVQAKGSEVEKQLKLVKPALNEFGFDYLGGFLFAGVGGRALEHIVQLAFDRTDPEETKRAYACFDKLVAVNAAAGFGLYRTNTAFMNKVADTYGPAQRAVNKRLKRALDPHGVLAPGKSGVHI
jgi:4-cresol dehydrogenase (hydroxylating)